MNKEQTKAAIEVMQAFVDGKEIQCLSEDGEWVPVSPEYCGWEWAGDVSAYRTRPEPKIIYVNEHETFGCISYSKAADAEFNGRDCRSVAVPYVRLSDVDLLK